MTNESAVKTLWTPGPWHVFDDTTVYGPGNPPPDEYVAECPYAYSPEASLDSVNKATAHANAHLIAAAPDLYEALADWLALEDEDLSGFGVEAAYYDAEYAKRQAAARAALAKARGEVQA